MNPSEKIIRRENIAEALKTLHSQKQQIVFTNGCFDILHAGHVRYLNSARSLGDALVIGLNSDTSVRAIKGPRRPLVVQDQRAEVLAALQCVDMITIFDEPDPYALIQLVKPAILVKGADWAEDQIIGGDWVVKNGGRVERIDVVPGISTSNIIDRILDVYSGEWPVKSDQ